MGCSNSLKEKKELVPELSKTSTTMSGKIGGINIEQYKMRVLLKHNELRNIHNSPELQFNEELNAKAQEYAKNLFESNNNKKKYFSFNMFKDSFLGENILIAKKKSPEDICKQWYDENKNYNYGTNKFQNNAAHFTQMIWKNTKEIGIGFHFDNDSNFCLVVYYYPSGNTLGEFSKNIHKPN